jgi:hypothetical protein
VKISGRKITATAQRAQTDIGVIKAAILKLVLVVKSHHQSREDTQLPTPVKGDLIQVYTEKTVCTEQEKIEASTSRGQNMPPPNPLI